MKNRFFFILINPTAGQKRYKWKIERLALAFKDRGYEYDIYYTLIDKKADAIIKENFDVVKYSDLLIMGGDGTLNEAVNGLGDRRVPISVVSTGTGNDSVRPIYKNHRFLDQLHIALDGKVVEVDAGICNGRLFVNGLGIGFDGKVAEITQKNPQKRPGFISYLQSVMKILATYKEQPLSFSIDKELYKETCLLLTIANGTTFGGGFKITPHAKVNDGLLEICIIGKIKPWKRFFHLPKLKNGRHGKISVVRFVKGKKVVVEANPEAVAHIDGEYFANPPFNISVLPDKLLFRIPN